MSLFKISSLEKETVVYLYEVEAETVEEAVEKIQQGKVTPWGKKFLEGETIDYCLDAVDDEDKGGRLISIIK